MPKNAQTTAQLHSSHTGKVMLKILKARLQQYVRLLKWMWELDYKESWAQNWCFELCCWRRLLRFPWTVRRSNQSVLKEISPGCSLEGLMLKLKLPILWPPDAKSWLIPTWCWERLRADREGDDENEMVGWHHGLDGHKFEQALGVGDGQGSVGCYSPWSHKESNMTEWLNWRKL